jgi:hypothetical protein
MTPRGRISALQHAWQDELFAEPYADLPPGERQVRDDAFKELLQDGLGAVLDVGPDLDDLNELEGLLSWIDDPTIWPPPPVVKRVRPRRRRSGGYR